MNSIKKVKCRKIQPSQQFPSISKMFTFLIKATETKNSFKIKLIFGLVHGQIDTLLAHKNALARDTHIFFLLFKAYEEHKIQEIDETKKKIHIGKMKHGSIQTVRAEERR